MPFGDKRPNPSVELLRRDITAQSIQAVLPWVREGLGGNQRTSPMLFCDALSKANSWDGWLLPIPKLS
jgi:hypothetical protein